MILFLLLERRQYCRKVRWASWNNRRLADYSHRRLGVQDQLRTLGFRLVPFRRFQLDDRQIIIDRYAFCKVFPEQRGNRQLLLFLDSEKKKWRPDSLQIVAYCPSSLKGKRGILGWGKIQKLSKKKKQLVVPRFKFTRRRRRAIQK